MPFINALPLHFVEASTARRALRSKQDRSSRPDYRDEPRPRHVFLLVCAMLAACDRSDEPISAPVAPTASPAAVPQANAADAARLLQEKAAAGLRAILPDPDDARYADLRAGTAGAVCGRVDTAQPDGERSGARPFVVTPDGVAVISLTPELMLNDPEDLFPDYYIRWCATTAELATLQVASDLDAAAPVTDLPADLPELAELPAPTADAPAPASGPAPAPPTSSLESFSKAVIRGEKPKQ